MIFSTPENQLSIVVFVKSEQKQCFMLDNLISARVDNLSGNKSNKSFEARGKL